MILSVVFLQIQRRLQNEKIQPHKKSFRKFFITTLNLTFTITFLIKCGTTPAYGDLRRSKL